MSDRMSLFARMLRAHRSGAGATVQGRMTQEQLAERLCVSVEAVSKYERSLSYVRGDIEARLIEGLGWSAADVAACRQDWVAHHLRPRQAGYRLLSAEEAEREFGGSRAEVARAIMRLIEREMPEIPNGFGTDDDIWVPILTRFFNHGALVAQGAELVAHSGILFLDEEDSAHFRACAFDETAMSAERLVRPILPGAYYGYCPVVVIARGHEAAAPLLLRSVQRFLEDLAERGVVLEGLGAAAVSAEGRQLCRQMGFERLGPHRAARDCEVWELPGRAIPGSILGRRSPSMAEVYRAAAETPH